MLKRFKGFIRTTLFGGVVVILPISIFIFLVKIIFDFIRSIVDPIARLIDFGQATDKLLIDLLAMAILIGFFFVVGLVVRTQMGKAFFHYVDSELLDKLPFYGTIKETVQQFTGAKKSPFSQVVLVDVFSNDTRMIGFISDEHDDGHFTVFVPTGPNPTNGFIFLVQRHQLQFVDVKTEEAMRAIIGVGTGASNLFYRKREEPVD